MTTWPKIPPLNFGLGRLFAIQAVGRPHRGVHLFVNFMNAWPICILLLAFLTAGCSTRPKHVTAAEFQRLYHSANAQTLEWYSYVGETNGSIYMSRSHVGLSGGNTRGKLYFTEIDGLPEEFLAGFQRNSKAKRGNPANRFLNDAR